LLHGDVMIRNLSRLDLDSWVAILIVHHGIPFPFKN
jgi:hypothetical protein